MKNLLKWLNKSAEGQYHALPIPKTSRRGSNKKHAATIRRFAALSLFPSVSSSSSSASVCCTPVVSSSSCSSSDRTYVNTAPSPLAHLRDFVRAFSLRRARSELDTRRSVRGRSVRHDREMAGRHADPFSAADSEQSFAQPLCFILCGI